MISYEKAHNILEDFQRILTQYRHISTNLTEANGIAITVLEKQEKYRWHDLRKNPSDIPIKYKDVLIYDTSIYNSSRYSMAVLTGTGWYSGSFISTPIAWRYIQPFEEGGAE